ncbi:MAG: XdhC family protein [Acidobacteriaceae bacterium]|nr:XdhC family protein [Acidobacteriaceae bacterium]
MKEWQQILDLWSRVEELGETAVLATVVKTQGSSYRLPGARLLLTSRGERVGSVSGGCLEDDLVKKGWWLTERGPVIRRYDTTPDGEIAAEYGLGCNGIIHVLLERLTPGESTVLELIREVRTLRKPAAFACVVSPKDRAGECLAIDSNGRVQSGPTSTVATNEELIGAMRSALQARTSHHLVLDSGEEVFIETLAPPVRVLVFGAGDDAKPVTALGRFLGWQVFVSDGRSHYARPEKFPDADKVLVYDQDASVLTEPVDDWTVAVSMTHSYSQDLRVLKELAKQPLRYLGLLGPKSRTLRMLSEAGLDASQMLPELHAPMGLDIGADGPEQVALSVIAEIQATLNGRSGGLLRQRIGSIHAREANEDDPAAAWVQSIACA